MEVKMCRVSQRSFRMAFSLSLVVSAAVVSGVEGTLDEANSYYFEPETLSVVQGASFEWHLMLVTEAELCGYGFAMDAFFGDTTVLSPDTLRFDWTDAACDGGEFEIRVGPEFDPDESWFGGGATSIVCAPGLPAGTHLGVRIFGTVSKQAVCGTYEFSGPHEGKSCVLTGTDEESIRVPVRPGHLRVLPTGDSEKMGE
jgi:hypothetical protein